LGGNNIYESILLKFIGDMNQVKAGDSEEFDHGCLIVGNVDNSTPPVNKICVGNPRKIYFFSLYKMFW